MDEMKRGAWYPVMNSIAYVTETREEEEQAVLKNAGGHWHYVYPSATSSSERGLARSLAESLLWLGVVDRAEIKGESVFRVTDLGRFLLSGEYEDKMDAAFPRREAMVVVQPNFDIVMPLDEADPLLSVPLDQFAERLSTGQAAVYHLSKESFTRGVQDGHDGEAFLDFLLRHNRGGDLPGNVLTTLKDWRGGMKRVRLRSIQVLESEDPLVIAELLHRRRFRKHLNAVDPHKTVGIAKISKAELTKALEKEGFVVD